MKARLAGLLKKAKAMVTNLAERAFAAVRDRLVRRRMSYRALFMDMERGELNPAGRVVMADLTKFCRGLTSTTVISPKSGMVDPYATGVAEGRREVWLRLVKELNLDPAQVMAAMKDEDALSAAA